MSSAASARLLCQFGPVVVEYDSRVLSPRAWTLEQSRWAAELAADAATGPILELCAGAGHIGLAAALLADRDLIQIELDPVAANYARANAIRAGVPDRVEVRTGRLQTAVGVDEIYPLIIADPPYLPTAQVKRWPEDPRRAIDGGTQGLDLILDCLEVASKHLGETGWLLLQVAGPAQADRVTQVLRAAPASALRPCDVRVVDEQRAVMLVGRS